MAVTRKVPLYPPVVGASTRGYPAVWEPKDDGAEEAETVSRWRVKAKKHGYYGGDRREGSTFCLKAPSDFAAAWMTPEGWDPGKPDGQDPETAGEAG